MDEQALSTPLSGPEQVSTRKLFSRRFGNFAWAHFCYSIACLLLSTFLIGILSSLAPLYWPDWLLEALFGWLTPLALMGGYALLGYWCGGKDVWPLPLRGRDLAWSVLAEAAVAWCWAAVVIWLFTSVDFVEGHSLVEAFFPSVFFLSVLGAFPSSFFVVMGVTALDFLGLASLVFMGFWAGLLPPLLFHLGSYLRTSK